MKQKASMGALGLTGGIQTLSTLSPGPSIKYPAATQPAPKIAAPRTASVPTYWGPR